jgi:cation diffusion facilitator family transporter
MNDHSALKERAALASVAASATLTIGKLVAGLLSGSLALMSEAVHNVLDTGATIVTWFAIRASGRPADDEHHYGHGKVEAVAALAETGFLIVLAVAVLIEAVRRFIGAEEAHVDASWLVFAVLIISIVVDLVRWRSLKEIAETTKSDALAADALHFSSDLFASICVLLGLVAARFGYAQGDTLAAVAVAIFIGIAGYRLGRRTIDTLVDVAPAGLTERVRAAVLATPGVVAIESVRLRPVGAEVYGEIGIGVPRTMPLEQVANVRNAVMSAIAKATPEVVATVSANPIALDDESVLERVLLISARRRLAVHHITIQEINGVRSVSLDIELDGAMQHGKAHDIATALEEAIERELGAGIEVETHIEPMIVDELAGQDIEPAQTAAIEAALVAAANEGGQMTNVHNVRVRQTSNGLVANYHCHVDPHQSVEAVHDVVDQVDRRLRRAFPMITRVVGHAEPTGE